MLKKILAKRRKKLKLEDDYLLYTRALYEHAIENGLMKTLMETKELFLF